MMFTHCTCLYKVETIPDTNYGQLYTQLIGTLTVAFGKFEQDKSNLINLVLCYLYSSLIDQ